jgi:S1-C subfamily serine protease
MDDQKDQQRRLPYRLRGVSQRLRKALPFTAGIIITLAALFVYNVLTPRPQPLTLTDVNDAVEQALQSATPQAAYSARVFQSIQASIVLIQTEIDSEDEDQSGRIGTGVIITEMGDILTSLHVVEDANVIRVIFADGTVSTAVIAGAQPENDIAVLQSERLPAVLIPAVLGNPNAMNVGDEAFVVGNPFGLYGSMSAGVISGFNRSFQVPESELRLDRLDPN